MQVQALIKLGWEALFLHPAPFINLREDPNPALRGLTLVVLIAVLVALGGLVGTALEWATTPSMSDVQQVVLEQIQAMDWYKELENEPEFRQQFPQWYELGWRVFPPLFGAPDVVNAATRIILLPLGLMLVWFLYGLVSHLCARLLGGQAGLGQTLGCTALALAPQLLNLATFFPYLVVGSAVGTWTLLGRYVALKTCHRMTWGRALAATLLPYLAFILTVSFFGCLGIAILSLFFVGGPQ